MLRFEKRESLERFKSMVICLQCQAANAASAHYCRRCGAPLPTAGDEGAQPLASSTPERLLGAYRVLRTVPYAGPGELFIVRRVGDATGDLALQWATRAGLDAEAEELLGRECQSLAAVHYPALPRVVDWFSTDEGMGVVLEPGGGDTLFRVLYPEAPEDGTVLRGRPLLPDVDVVIHWGLQLADALTYLHQQQPFPILHRGLSPWTVWFDRGGLLHVLAYGPLNIFRRVGADGANGSLATRFADPALHATRWTDPRSDLYAMGRFLDFALTGQLPDRAGAAPLFPQGLPPAATMVHTHLANIITRCCQDNLSERFTDSEALRVALASVSDVHALGGGPGVTCECGYWNRADARFCEQCGRWLSRDTTADDSALAPVVIPVTYVEQGQAELVENYRQGHFAPLSRFRLRETLDDVQSDPGFDQLISLETLPYVEKLPHQKDAALRVLKQMRGRALLADEVGLGKTIEAGIILKELILRRLVQSIVIFCPVQLQGQWQSELYEKFDEVFLVMGRDIGTSLAWRCSRLIASYDIAHQRFHVEEMLRHRYDLVVLDEAHWLNDPGNARILRVMKNLQKKYFLLLSATPIHNSLDELYNIITLLRPGHFSDLDSFRREFVDPENPTRPVQTDVLRGYLHAVMVRNRRVDVHLEHPFPVRQVKSVSIHADPDALAFYEEFRQFYHDHLASIGNRSFLLRMSELVERFCSSGDAFSALINRLRNDAFIRKNLSREFARKLEDFAARYPDALIEPKVQALEKGLRELFDQGRKVLVFSQFGETADYLYKRIQGTDLADLSLHYDETRPLEERMYRLEVFRDRQAGALFCPGEASEGLNLQFASAMINFDLPWDPMKLEQRIGRIQRMGSPHPEVLIVNLLLQGTIEEDIWRVCENKLAMIQPVVGQLEQILGNLREEDNLPSIFTDWFLDRPRENEDGEPVAAETYLDDILEDPVALAQAGAEQDPLNIIFDFSMDGE